MDMYSIKLMILLIVYFDKDSWSTKYLQSIFNLTQFALEGCLTLFHSQSGTLQWQGVELTCQCGLICTCVCIQSNTVTFIATILYTCIHNYYTVEPRLSETSIIWMRDRIILMIFIIRNSTRACASGQPRMLAATH